MLADAFDQVEAGTARFTPQPHEAATYCGMLSKEDGHIDWRRPAIDLHNLVRGALPWPVAQCAFRGAPFKVYASRLAEAPGGEPGEIIGIEPDAILVAAGQGTLAITRLQAPGKRVMTAKEFLPGARLRLGERFGVLGQEVR